MAEKDLKTEDLPAGKAGKKELSVIKDAEKPQGPHVPAPFSPRLIGLLADEITKTMVKRFPFQQRQTKKKKSNGKKAKKIEYAVFLDTSAIIDGRIFDVINMGLLNGNIVIAESILLELKHIADSQDTVKRERGRKGLEFLEKLKKNRSVKVVVAGEEFDKNLAEKHPEVDERLIRTAKFHKGKIITCDYNLEKKANIEGVRTVNVNALANALKVTAVPGEAVHIKLLHKGKDVTQGVGYLDDGTMIVVEQGSEYVGHTIDVVVSRVIQTATGRILFAKRI
jgi:uncharacterized protein YacL